MAERNSIAVTVRPTESAVYWGAVIVNAGQFGLGILPFVLVVLLFVAGFLVHGLNPGTNPGWYRILEKWKPVFWLCLFPVLIVFVGSWVTTKRYFRDLSKMLGVTFRFSDLGVEVEPSVGEPHLDWSAFRHARETRAAFLLFGTDGEKRVIPKRCIPGDIEMQVLRRILQRHIASFRP